jgi:hypothetical protein
MAINYWTTRRGKRLATREINGLLVKFVGRKLNPLDELFAAMRKVVLKYFKANPDKLQFFSDGLDPFDYNFEVEEQNGFVTNVDFQAT